MAKKIAKRMLVGIALVMMTMATSLSASTALRV